MVDFEQISTPIADFCRLSGLGRTKVYELIDSGQLQTVLFGRRRLVLLDSYRRLIATRLATQQPAPAAGRPPKRGRGRPPKLRA